MSSLNTIEKIKEFNETGGAKHDAGKPRIDLVPPDVILEVAKVLTSGVDEYGEHNWRKGIAYSRLYSAIQRHLLDFWKGNDVDGSGHRALAHACTDIMMLMEMPREWDDRYKSNSKPKLIGNLLAVKRDLLADIRSALPLEK